MKKLILLGFTVLIFSIGVAYGSVGDEPCYKTILKIHAAMSKIKTPINNSKKYMHDLCDDSCSHTAKNPHACTECVTKDAQSELNNHLDTIKELREQLRTVIATCNLTQSKT